MDELRELNFKLLTVFDSVMRNRSISNAAKELGISQPSVSSQLARLRVVLDDDLFIRISNGVLPTTFSESLHPYVCTVLQSLQYGIDQSRKFDQAKEKRTFTLIMTDIGEVTILPELLYRVNKKAPNISLRTVNLAPSEVPEALKSGFADMAIAYMPDLESNFYQRHLFDTGYICITRIGHPLAKPGFTKEDFESAKHVVAEAQGTGHLQFLEKTFAKLGVHRTVGVSVPHFMSMPYLVAKTDLIATVPRNIAYAFRYKLNICVLKHPIDLPTIDVKLLWHERFNGDQANQWLREETYQACQGIDWKRQMDNLSYI
tara:strand:+ start:12387 stop:13334 length:948 start_codon:yes stop_codon:yes gene_type:complete